MDLLKSWSIITFFVEFKNGELIIYHRLKGYNAKSDAGTMSRGFTCIIDIMGQQSRYHKPRNPYNYFVRITV